MEEHEEENDIDLDVVATITKIGKKSMLQTD